MSVLAVWHAAAVVASYRERFRALCRENQEINLHVTAPEKKSRRRAMDCGKHGSSHHFSVACLCDWMDDAPRWALLQNRVSVLTQLESRGGAHSSGSMDSGGPAIRIDLLSKGSHYHRNVEECGVFHKKAWIACVFRVIRRIVGVPEISRNALPKGMCVVIDSPNETIPFRPIAGRSLCGVSKIGNVGRLTWERGLGLLLDAVPYVSQNVDRFVRNSIDPLGDTHCHTIWEGTCYGA